MRKRIKPIPDYAEKLISNLPYGWSNILSEKTGFVPPHVVNVLHSGDKKHKIWNEAVKLALEFKTQKEENDKILDSL